MSLFSFSPSAATGAAGEATIHPPAARVATLHGARNKQRQARVLKREQPAEPRAPLRAYELSRNSCPC